MLFISVLKVQQYSLHPVINRGTDITWPYWWRHSYLFVASETPSLMFLFTLVLWLRPLPSPNHEEICSINTTAFSSCMIGVSSSADRSWVWRRFFVFNITLRFHIPDIASQPGALDRQETRFKSSLRVKRDCFFNTAVRIIVTIENKYFRNRCGWNKRSCESALSCLPWGLAARSHAC